MKLQGSLTVSFFRKRRSHSSADCSAHLVGCLCCTLKIIAVHVRQSQHSEIQINLSLLKILQPHHTALRIKSKFLDTGLKACLALLFTLS